MDAKALYWTGAFVNLGIIVALAARGVVQVRRGEVEAHRRSMLMGAFLIVAFMMSYVLKLALLGREDLSLWSPLHINNLRFHETCVALMIIAGAVALTRARRMRGKRQRTRNPEHELAPASTVAWHRRAGWASLVGALAGFLSAAVILVGMYGRL